MSRDDLFKINLDESSDSIDDLIDASVDKKLELDDCVPNQLNSVSLKKEIMKIELNESLKLNDYLEFSRRAIDVITHDAIRYLTEAQWDLLKEEILDTSRHFEKLDPKAISSLDYTSLHNMSEQSREALTIVGIAKFNEMLYRDSLSLFMFLILLNPQCSDYWFRSGIAALYSEDFALGARNFTAAANLNPDLIEAHLFAAKCLLKDRRPVEAEEAYTLAKLKYQGSESKEIVELFRDFSF
jgi:tetratricopeptide (TPR) repeat protein